MIKHYFGFCLLLGLGITCTAQSQSPDNCDAAVQAYQRQRDECSDLNQQLLDLKTQIGALQSQREALLARCAKENKPNPKKCDELADLVAGRLSILQQQYMVLAQSGCQAAPVRTVINACKPSNANVTKQEAVSKAEKQPATKPATTPATVPATTPATTPVTAPATKPAKVPSRPVTATSDRQDVPRTNPRPGLQPQITGAAPPRSAGGNTGGSTSELSGRAATGAAAPTVRTADTGGTQVSTEKPK